MPELFDAHSEPIAVESLRPLAALPPTPITILERAVDRGLDADQLEKLMAMQERWERNQAEKAYNEAMHACQEEMPSVVKSKENTQTRSRFADLEATQKTARPVYAKHGFSLCFGEAECPLANHKRTVCDVLHVQGHCRQYYLDLPVDGIGPKGNPIGGMNAVQGAISTTSYGQRRLLCMIFNITLAGEDDDGAGATQCIDDEQAATLREWMASTNADEKRFLKFLGVEKLADLPAKRYAEALTALQNKAAKR